MKNYDSKYKSGSKLTSLESVNTEVIRDSNYLFLKKIIKHLSFWGFHHLSGNGLYFMLKFEYALLIIPYSECLGKVRVEFKYLKIYYDFAF